MKILLKGYYGFGNLGDDVLMLVSYHLITKLFPTAEIVIFSNYTHNLTDFNNELGYNRYICKLLRTNVKLVDWKHNGHYDYIIYGGGGIYFDHESGSFFRRIMNVVIKKLGSGAINKFDQWIRYILNKPNKITASKKMAIGVGLAKYTSGSKLFYEHMADIGSVSKFFVRDNVSVLKLKELKYPKDVIKLTDLAFLTSAWANGIGVTKITRSLGVVLLDWDSQDNERFRRISKIAEQLINSGFTVNFYSFDENHDESFIQFFSDKSINVWRPNQIKLGAYLKQFSSNEIIVTSRAHGAILGAILGAIPVCINISIKLQQVAAMFPSSGKLIEDFCPDEELVQTIEEIQTNLPAYQNRLKSEVASSQEKIQQLESYLKSELY